MFIEHTLQKGNVCADVSAKMRTQSIKKSC